MSIPHLFYLHHTIGGSTRATFKLIKLGWMCYCPQISGWVRLLTWYG
jgi:hypothetical protein